jgi:hypothetical protein
MRQITKPQLAVSLGLAGRTLEECARAMECHPSFIERWWEQAGLRIYTNADLERERAAGWVIGEEVRA